MARLSTDSWGVRSYDIKGFLGPKLPVIQNNFMFNVEEGYERDYNHTTTFVLALTILVSYTTTHST